MQTTIHVDTDGDAIAVEHLEDGTVRVTTYTDHGDTWTSCDLSTAAVHDLVAALTATA